MHSRNFKPGSARPQRSRAPFQGGRSNPFNNGGGRKKRFTGNYIDISKFINKAEPVQEAEAYVPDTLFADFSVEESIKKNIAARGFEHPTPIQDKTIPHILEGKDLIGLANTGTGKTGAFLIPMLDKIIKNPNEKLLVVVPTRELAIQIQEEFR